MITLLDCFNSGMKKQIRPFLRGPDGPQVNLGAGSSALPGVDNLDVPEWKAPLLPYDDESVAAVYAFHFLEHLDKDMIIAQLREIERVLMFDGIFVSVIPHWSCELAFQDLDHKSFWSETTWGNLMSNPHYRDRKDGAWQLEVQTCLIMGVVSRNLVIVTQIVKL